MPRNTNKLRSFFSSLLLMNEKKIKFLKIGREFNALMISENFHIPSNFVNNFGKWLFPCIDFNRLNALDNFIHNTNSSISVTNQVQTILCRHFPYTNYKTTDTLNSLLIGLMIISHTHFV